MTQQISTQSRKPGMPGRPACPPIGVLMRYRDRMVRVVAEARGQRVVIESVDGDGRMFRSAVKWANLTSLSDPLF